MIKKDSDYQPDVNATRYLYQIGIDWARAGAPALEEVLEAMIIFSKTVR